AWMGGFAALAASLMLVAGLNFDGQEALKNGRQPLDGLATAEPAELGSGPAVDEPQPSSVPDSSTIVAVPTAPAEDVADPQPSAVAQSQPTETPPAAERIAMLDRNDRKMET